MVYRPEGYWNKEMSSYTHTLASKKCENLHHRYMNGVKGNKKRQYHINIGAYLSFIQYKRAANRFAAWRLLIFCCFDTGIHFEDLKLVQSKSIEMNHPQTYRGSSIYIGWISGMLNCDNSISPLLTTLPSFKKCPHSRKCDYKFLFIFIKSIGPQMKTSFISTTMNI